MTRGARARVIILAEPRLLADSLRVVLAEEGLDVTVAADGGGLTEADFDLAVVSFGPAPRLALVNLDQPPEGREEPQILWVGLADMDELIVQVRAELEIVAQPPDG